MNSRERRLLHMAFRDIEGVETASSGEGQDRFLAVYPAGKTDLPVAPPVKPRGFERGGGRDRGGDRGRGPRTGPAADSIALARCMPTCPARTGM
jgi:spoIIIJ-associated protein